MLINNEKKIIKGKEKVTKIVEYHALMGAPSPTLNLFSKLILYLKLNQNLPLGICLKETQEGQTKPQ
jgi:hypothetical protein